MGQYNYKITSIPALPRSAMRKERNISTSGSISSLYGGDSGVGLEGYVKWDDILKTTDTVPKEYLDTNIMSALLVKRKLLFSFLRREGMQNKKAEGVLLKCISSFCKSMV